MSKIEELIGFLQDDEILQCALTEAVHRFYYHNCFNPYSNRPTLDTKRIHHLHQTLSCKIPDWRYKLKKHMERYHGNEPTSALHTDCKPKDMTGLRIEISLLHPITPSLTVNTLQ